MARTKQLTDAQRAGLKRLREGPAIYYELARVGATAPTIKWLCNKEFAVESRKENGDRTWSITDAGKEVHTMNEATIIDEVVAMDGHKISELTTEQGQTLNHAIEKSRQLGLVISVTNLASREDLAKAGSPEEAERIQAEAGSIVSVRKSWT